MGRRDWLRLAAWAQWAFPWRRVPAPLRSPCVHLPLDASLGASRTRELASRAWRAAPSPCLRTPAVPGPRVGPRRHAGQEATDAGDLEDERIEITESLLSALRERHARHAALQRRLSGEGVAEMDPAEVARLNKELGSLAGVAAQWEERERLLEEIRGLREAADDPGEEEEVRALCRDDLSRAEGAREALEQRMAWNMVPRDEEDEAEGLVLEVKGAVGGEEACVFAGELLAMYRSFCHSRGWRFDVISQQSSEYGHCKHAVVDVTGAGAYRALKHEAGIHRVQRVPDTIKADKVQTSAAAVLVLPRMGEAQVQLDMRDVAVEVMRSSGAGGQHVNTTESAVRVTHLPTGVSVRVQDGRSQHQNRERALQILRAKLLDAEKARATEARGQEASQQLGTGDRSAKIRTYNFKDGRVTDHRVGLVLYKLSEVLKGEALGELVDAMGREERRRRAEELVGAMGGRARGGEGG